MSHGAIHCARHDGKRGAMHDTMCGVMCSRRVMSLGHQLWKIPGLEIARTLLCFCLPAFPSEFSQDIGNLVAGFACFVTSRAPHNLHLGMHQWLSRELGVPHARRTIALGVGQTSLPWPTVPQLFQTSICL